jgi:protein lifeguard
VDTIERCTCDQTAASVIEDRKALSSGLAKSLPVRPAVHRSPAHIEMSSTSVFGMTASASAAQKPEAGPSDAESDAKEAEDLLRSTVEEDFAVGTTVATSSASVRLGFLRKVYSILALQLALTTFICGIFMLPPVRGAVLAVGGVLTFVGFIATFGCIFALMANKDVFPLNMKLLAAFTVGESLLIGTICAQYAQAGLGYLVLEALVITLAIFTGLTAYCLTTKRDFQFLGAGLFAALIALIGASFVNLIMGFTGGKSEGLAFLISWGGATIFSLFILYDTSQLMQRLSPDDYIVACVSLYLDAINLFLHILAVLSRARDN